VSVVFFVFLSSISHVHVNSTRWAVSFGRTFSFQAFRTVQLRGLTPRQNRIFKAFPFVFEWKKEKENNRKRIAVDRPLTQTYLPYEPLRDVGHSGFIWITRGWILFHEILNLSLIVYMLYDLCISDWSKGLQSQKHE